MSTTAKSLVFLAVTFAFSWGICLLGWRAGSENSAIATFLTLFAMMAGPAVGALVCAFAFEKDHRVEALGLRFKPNLWWLYAWLIPVAICIGALVITMLAGHPFTDPGTATIAAVQGHVPAAKMEQLRQLQPYLTPILLGQVLIGTLINAVAITFTEELGWRGYLHYLWRPSGFWRASLATGVIWGVWHAPAIYIYGLNYPNDRLIGIPVFIVFCTLLAPVMTLIRDRAGATWATGLTHGAINASAGLVVLCVGNPAFPWNGLVGIGGFIALAMALAAVALARPGLAPKAATA
ncbi:MAG TPA: CPBP family intramembrane glutamic endopeptidase [Vitreimonas sp.]|jgi:membrane protease YdiL (CAAX protease family)|nr:CPBP family intramembrane glutamic endopeptidase [Vitreimonas sp.]